MLCGKPHKGSGKRAFSLLLGEEEGLPFPGQLFYLHLQILTSGINSIPLTTAPRGMGVREALSAVGFLTGKGTSTSSCLFYSHRTTTVRGLIVTLECSHPQVLLPPSRKVAGQLRIMAAAQRALRKGPYALRPWAPSFTHRISFHLHMRLITRRGWLSVPEGKQPAQGHSLEEQESGNVPQAGLLSSWRRVRAPSVTASRPRTNVCGAWVYSGDETHRDSQLSPGLRICSDTWRQVGSWEPGPAATERLHMEQFSAYQPGVWLAFCQLLPTHSS